MGGASSVSAGVDFDDFLPPGEPVNLGNCAREPIHLPGSIQPHGLLFVVGLTDGKVVQASENAAEMLGWASGSVLGSQLAKLLGAEAEDLLARGASPDPQTSTIAVAGRQFDALTYEAELGFRVVELEPSSDETGDGPRPEDELDVLALIDELSSATESDQLLTRAAITMREVTGHERVWAYRFEDDGHGVIVAESKSDDLDSFLGLHYPEGDIPAQARALYLRNGLRTIVDAQASPVAVTPLTNPETGAWTDMSDGALRAVSPMHVTYLTQMGVRASISAAIVVDGRLWGLLSGHHYDQPRRLSRHARTLVEVLARLVGIQIDALERSRSADELLTLRQHQAEVLEQVAQAADLPAGLAADPAALLGVCRAGGAIIRVGSEMVTVGQTPKADRCAALLEAIVDREDGGEGLCLDALSAEHAEFAQDAPTAAGILVLPLSRRQGNLLVWLRPEQVREVTWGNGARSGVSDAGGVEPLTPRGSFERWKEIVRLRSRPWRPEELTSAYQLRSSLGTLLLSRAEALARVNAELLRVNGELDDFAHTAAHDLREPLRGMNSLTTFVIEDSWDVLDETARNRLTRVLAHAHRMEKLLDSLLGYATLGRAKLELEEASVLEVAKEAVEVLLVRAEDKAAELRYGPDATVSCDRPGLLEVLVNLVDNALKYGPDAAPVIEIGVIGLGDTVQGSAAFAPLKSPLAENPDPVVVYVADNGIGIAPENREEVFRIFHRLHAPDAHGGGSGAGLSIARRIVERHGGNIWIEDGIDGGVRVCFTLEGR
jgi:light-regulated signal transduction histidine kinase (bacteriophytochrome)